MGGIYPRDDGRIFFEEQEVHYSRPIEAQNAGITINGLPILCRYCETGRAGYDDLEFRYETEIIGGPGAFVVPAEGGTPRQITSGDYHHAGMGFFGTTISWTPDGKYLITARKAGSSANMLKIADFLVNKERAAAGS